VNIYEQSKSEVNGVTSNDLAEMHFGEEFEFFLQAVIT